MSTFDDLRDNLLGAIRATGDAVTAQGKLQDALAAEQAELWRENAELRDELHALSNRVEAITRALLTEPADVAARMIDCG